MVSLENILGSDSLIGLTVGGILLVAIWFNVLSPLENLTNDWVIRAMPHDMGQQVAVIAIDDKSLAKLGDWPWSRSMYATLTELVAPYSKVVGMTLDFSQAQQFEKPVEMDNFLTAFPKEWFFEEIAEFKQRVSEMSKLQGRSMNERTMIKQFIEFYKHSPIFSKLYEMFLIFSKYREEETSFLNPDEKFANSLKKFDNVVLGMPELLEEVSPKLAPQLPEYVSKYSLKVISDDFEKNSSPLFKIHRVNPPIESLGKSVLGMGYMNIYRPLNARYMPLVVKYNEIYLPSLALWLVAKNLRLEKTDIEVRLGKGIRLGELRINTDANLQMQPFFYHPSALQIDSIADVLTGQVAPHSYQDKIVLVGVTAKPYSVLQDTPVGPMPAVTVLAHQVASLLNHDFFSRPQWLIGIEISLISLTLIYLCFWLPALRIRPALICSGVWLSVLIMIQISLMKHHFLAHIMPGVLLLLGGHLALWVKRAWVAYQEAFRLHPDAVESNRLLGLAFQGQGQLDMAYEKFRLCPADDSILGLLYNLALDYERKRQFRRARAVYRYMIGQNPDFRDIEQRLRQLGNLRKPKLRSRAMWLDEWLSDDSGEKPLIGRYQIERVLGKGAMTVVYLGRDYKLDRLVAIKTLALSQEFDAEELEEATARFFREATAAGRLKQPNIISIYDAGEEQDLAYMAMEYVKGGNLEPYTRAENLLPITTVIKIVIDIAEALDYASKQGVVHRDIKPANIMYNSVTEQIKITDFGIARITEDTNKTKTGIILGTPSYMSPEQLEGQELDGRTDLFSLGVMLYQLLSGQLPFQADTLATLMFKIVNESHIDIQTVRTDITSCLKQAVDKALQKDKLARFQTGCEFAKALRDCQTRGEVQLCP